MNDREIEGEQKAQATLMDLEYQLKYEQQALENKTLSKKMERVLKENEDMKLKLVSLSKELEEFESGIDIPSNEDEVIEMAKALKASQLLLQQKSFDVQTPEEMIIELNIRLELERDRRMR